jgi:hypothetical protein
MTDEYAPACEHGIPAYALSAWRDGDLPEAEQRRVGDHVAGCPACRTRLADYEALIAALRRQRVPVTDARLWQRVSARAAAASPSPVRVAVTRHPLAVALSTAGILAALLALVLGFAHLLSQAPRSSPPASIKGWTLATFPPGFTLDFPSLVVVDGDTAYACVTALAINEQQKPTVQGGATQFWVTHNRGVSWTRRADLPILNINQCQLTVDDLDPNIITVFGRAIPLHSGGLAGFLPSDGNGPNAAVSFDGGASWQPSDNSVFQHATVGDATIGYTTYGFVSSTSYPHALMISRDQMRTWQPIDNAIVAAGQRVWWFALETTLGQGKLLAAAVDSSTTSTNAYQHLWASNDGGAQWREMNSPATSTDDYYVIQQHTADQPANPPLELCAELYPITTVSSPPSPPIGISCSAEPWATWQSVPLPPPSTTCAASPSPSAAWPRLQAITANGDLYMDDGGCDDTLYRLPARSDTWQVVATAPKPKLDLNYYPTSGVVWTMPRLTDPYTQVDLAGYVYTRSLAG